MASPLMRPADQGRPAIVIALGGNALLRRSEPMTADVQRRNVKVAARAIAPLTVEIEAIRRLLESESVVICAGGGGIPTMRIRGGALEGRTQRFVAVGRVVRRCASCGADTVPTRW